MPRFALIPRTSGAILLPSLGDQIVSTHFSQYAVRVIYALVWAMVCFSVAKHGFAHPAQAGPDTRLGTMVPGAPGWVVFWALRGSSRRSSGRDPERAPCELPAHPPAKLGS
jgi:hypothetical protein